MHMDNLESMRRDRHNPSTSGDDPVEDGSEEDPSRQRQRSKGKRRAFDDSSKPEGNQAYGSTYIARSLPRPEEGFKDKMKGEVHILSV